LNKVIQNNLFLLLFILEIITYNNLNAQELGELGVENVPDGQGVSFIVRDPNEAILVVHSAIPELFFESNSVIIKVDNTDPGEYRLHLQPGTHIITYKAEGYSPIKERIYIEKKQYKEVKIIIVKRPVSTIATGLGVGDVLIESIPSGATVFWDGIQLADKTPLTLKNQRAFVHVLGLSVYGDEFLPVDTLVVVSENDETKVKVTLPRVSDKNGQLVLNSNMSKRIKGVIIYSGESTSFTIRPGGSSEFSLQPGAYSVEVEENGYEYFQQYVEITENSTTYLSVDLIPITGKLSIYNPTEAIVTGNLQGTGILNMFEVNGTNTFEVNGMDSIEFDLKPGKYYITVDILNFEIFEQSLQVNQDLLTQFTLDLIPDYGILSLSSSMELSLTGSIKGKTVDRTFQILPANKVKFNLKKGKYKIFSEMDGFKPYRENIFIENNLTKFLLDITLNPIDFKRARRLSLLYPGTGQYYSNQKSKGFIFAGLMSFGAYMIIKSYLGYNDAVVKYNTAGNNYSNAKLISDMTLYREEMGTWSKTRDKNITYISIGTSVAIITYIWNIIDIQFRYPWQKTNANEN